MIKPLLLIILLGATFSLVVNAQAPPPPSVRPGPPAPPPAPLIYSPPAGSDLVDHFAESKLFSARFPGKPLVRTQNMGDAVILSYRVYRKGSNSVVSVTETTKMLGDRSEEAFRQIRGAIVDNGGKIEEESEVSTSGWKGKEFGFSQDHFYRRIRVFIVGARIFEIQSDVTNWHIIGEKVKEDWRKETNRFFESFKIL